MDYCHLNKEKQQSNVNLSSSVLTLMMIFAQVVEASVNVITNSPFQGYMHLDNRTSLTYE